MRDYKTNNYDQGYTTSPLLFVMFIVMMYLLADLSWQQIYDYFNF